jgi:hypothetical protein
VALPPSPLEVREKLEQLRALEAGMRIDVAVVDTVPLGVDTPHDLEIARQMLAEDHHDPTNENRLPGRARANSHIAIAEAFPDATPLPCATFEDALAAISSGEAALGMIPIENTLAGRVADIHHLLPQSGLFIVGEWFLPIRHQLMGLRGAKLGDIKTVESHVHASDSAATSSASSASNRSLQQTPPARRASCPNGTTRAARPLHRASPPISTASTFSQRTSRTRATTPRAL